MVPFLVSLFFVTHFRFQICIYFTKFLDYGDGGSQIGILCLSYLSDSMHVVWLSFECLGGIWKNIKSIFTAVNEIRFVQQLCQLEFCLDARASFKLYTLFSVYMEM